MVENDTKFLGVSFSFFSYFFVRMRVKWKGLRDSLWGRELNTIPLFQLHPTYKY